MPMTTTFTATASGQYWTWREQKIYYVQAGQNLSSPPLLLIHGFGASTDHWQKNISELSREFEVWAIDLLGFGRSAKPNWQYGGDLWREQLHDFISEIIKRPTVLAGNSIGGYACLTVAADYPESVAGVILLNSAGSFTDTNPLGAKKISPLQKFLRDLSQSLLKQSWAISLLFQFVKQRSQIRKTLLKVYINKSAVTDELIANIQRPANDLGAIDVFRSVFSSPQGKKVDELLQTMNCPLLAIWGEADPWMNTQARGAKFKEYYPSLTEHYIKSGHCPHDDTPELVNPIIKDWLKSWA
ncbi:alpha/beta fold hydrolase [Synechococcus sp. PCC 7502]|uniref:alpha/beta fold hydrolase n=1 Tax=Synechococcus sp. PCC 7502 TaxID=1173263 RepID=UPI000302B6F4